MTSRLQNLTLFLGRLVTGIYFINFGISALWSHDWSLSSLVAGAHLFSGFYQGVVHSPTLPALVMVIKIGAFVIGVLLIVGMFVRIAALLGTILMLFLYFPAVLFPYVCAAGGSSCSTYIVNDHLLVAALLLILFAFQAGETFSLGTLFHFSKY